jgi:hypothetical protein
MLDLVYLFKGVDMNTQMQPLTQRDKNEIISKCRKVERGGLYFMVFILFVHGCADTTVSRLRRIEDKLDSLLGNTNLIQSIQLSQKSITNFNLDASIGFEKVKGEK